MYMHQLLETPAILTDAETHEIEGFAYTYEIGLWSCLERTRYRPLSFQPGILFMLTLWILYHYLGFPEIWQVGQCSSFRWILGMKSFQKTMGHLFTTFAMMFTHLLCISKAWNSAYRNLQVLKKFDFVAFTFFYPWKKKKLMSQCQGIFIFKILSDSPLYKTGTYMSINPCI